MIRKLLSLLIFFTCSIACAETIKTDVLVVGGGASGVAAAIQSARSNVKTLLIEQSPWLGGSMTAGGMCILDANRNLPSGIYEEFRSRINTFYKSRLGYDTTKHAVLTFEPGVGASVLKKWTDTVKHLTVKMGVSVATVKKDGTGWEVTVNTGDRTDVIKAKVLVDATELGDIGAKAGALFNSGFDSRKETGEALAPENSTNQIQDISWLAILKDYGKAANKVIPKPDGYDASQYACLKKADIKKMLKEGALINDKYLINWLGCANQYSVTSNDLLAENRANTFRQSRLRTLGLIYFLQTELGYKNLGFADEFPTTDHLPLIPYIRENRRALGVVRMVLGDIYTPYDRASKLFRTSIGVADAVPTQAYIVPGAPKINYPPFPAYSIPMGAVVVKEMENLLVIEKAMSVTHLVNGSVTHPAVQMTMGQGAGATAAYCAFYTKNTNNLDVRKIQEEILIYSGSIMPYADVLKDDPDYRAIQQVGATGLLEGFFKPQGKSAQMLFKPDTIVYTVELRDLLNDMYTRSFIWFNKNQPGEKFTVGNLISYISEMSLAEPENLQRVMQANWKTKYKFPTPFDPKRPVTRREFAALANRYLNPFSRKVDMTGKLIN